MNKGILVIFVDAFSHDYINSDTTPFLSQHHVSSLKPVFGFRQLYAAFTGNTPLDSGRLTEYYYDPNFLNYRLLDLIPASLLSSAESTLNFLMSRFINVMNIQKTPKRIPISLLSLFRTDEEVIPQKTRVISMLRREEFKSNFILYPKIKNNDHALKTLLREASKNDFLFVHFPDLDGVTHAKGISSREVTKLIRKTDSIIEEISSTLGDDYKIITFSDHGMVPVEGKVDVLSALDDVGRVNKDFIVFLDSIMARIWFRNNCIEKSVIGKLKSMDEGKCILPENQNFRRRMGDVLFVCDPGYIVYPNYYDWSPPKAMHGYLPQDEPSSLNGIFMTENLSGVSPGKVQSMTDVSLIFRKTIEKMSEL